MDSPAQRLKAFVQKKSREKTQLEARQSLPDHWHGLDVGLRDGSPSQSESELPRLVLLANGNVTVPPHGNSSLTCMFFGIRIAGQSKLH
ncbi:hypothetical protein C8R44DRAFT_783052 [Mycena epipterygia]|nr:hypothetical protein C8R44DRAFT_783052 [Mycena epipterygia]